MNYRDAQATNIRKTNYVLAFYLAIFIFIGFLGDSILISSKNPNIGLLEIFQGLATLQIFPLATLIMGAVSALIIYLTMTFGNKIMLSGNEYKRLDGNDDISMDEQQVVNLVEELIISARLRFKPEIYVMETEMMNAFASGWNENNSLVCVTRGLMDRLNREELEAVIAHELAHIRNGDIKLTLVVGVLNNILVWAVDIMFHMFMGNSRESKNGDKIRMILLVLKFTLPVITFVLQFYLSRTREYMADAGSVEFTTNPEAMISALKKISGYAENTTEGEDDNKSRRFAYIYAKDGWFATHPSIENRIASLKGEPIL